MGVVKEWNCLFLTHLLLVARIIPRSAHAAFDKACSYFNIKLIQVDVDPITRKVDIKAVKRNITGNTILVGGKGFGEG